MFRSGRNPGPSIDRVLIFERQKRRGKMESQVISDCCGEFGGASFLDRVLIEAAKSHQPLTATSDQGDQK
jgi:hypothetical protein